MDKTSLVLSGLLSLAFVLMLAPGVLARNKGNILRNIALWVAIFLGLALIYQQFGPGKTAPSTSAFMADKGPSAASEETTGKDEEDSAVAPDLNEEYTPPKD